MGDSAFRVRIRLSMAYILFTLTLVAAASCAESNEVRGTERPTQSDQIDELYFGWSPAEISALTSLWIETLQPLPADPSNKYADDERAAALGQLIFFDTRFSTNGQVACASCHQPDHLFTDNLTRAEAIGQTPRHTLSIVGTAYSPWLFWDGSRDSQWAQALGPMENPVEHGGSRTQYAHLIDENGDYHVEYEAIFGQLADISDRSRFPDSAGPNGDSETVSAWNGMHPDDKELINQIFANIGKAIAAYERRILPGPSRFDGYVEALLAGDESAMDATFTEEEEEGLKLFINKGNCTQCHNSPLLTNNGFHSAGVPTNEEVGLDIGRFRGVQLALEDEFNCLGQYSDAIPEECPELVFVKRSGQELMGAFKVPSLRNVAETAPYMHAGQFESLGEVLDHYNRAEAGPTGHTDLVPLGLTSVELEQLEAFLATLSGELNVDPKLLKAP